ncbi:MAG: SocA family protein [Ignavibacteriae bacterium]|nr:SocA family protein [Ignavibacteriota bacterium]
MFKNITDNKIGNILFYLSSKIEFLSLTKAIKLLYLIDEISVKKSGVPVTWSDYKVWKYGPVPEDIYDEIKYGRDNFSSTPLEDFLTIDRSYNETRNQEEVKLKPNSEHTFDDSELSDYEINLIDEVISKYGNKSATEIIEILHKEGTLWHSIVEKKRLQESFKIRNNKSNYSIEFVELIKDDIIKSLAMKSALESIELHSQLSN